MLITTGIDVNETADHAIYLSTIRIHDEDDHLIMQVNIFEDDLRDALRDHHGEVIDTSALDFEIRVNDYMKEHLVINLNDDIRLLVVKDVIRVGDTYQVAYSPIPVSSIAKIALEADYLMELFPMQQNILQLEYQDHQYYHIFKKGSSYSEIVLTR